MNIINRFNNHNDFKSDGFLSKFEMERALMEVKITAENKCLAEEESNCEKIKVKIIELEEDYIAKREKVRFSLVFMRQCMYFK